MLPRLSDPKSPRAAERSRYIAAAKPFGFRGVGLYFQSKVADALVRNDLRPAEQGGPLVGVLGTYKRLQVPEPEEGFDALFFARLGPDGFTVEEGQREVR